MSWRVLVLLATLAVAGVAGGYAFATARAPVAADGTARPIPASSPSLPIDPSTPPRPYEPDIDWPVLASGLPLASARIGEAPYTWRYPYPKGWVATPEGNNELRYRPVGEPDVGGYSLRVKLINAHLTPSDMVAAKVAALQPFDDLVILDQTASALYFTYRDSATNRLRYNFFRWFAAPGSAEATFEMSVAGRASDETGLRDLFGRFADGLRKV